jgi:hypothetical protein
MEICSTDSSEPDFNHVVWYRVHDRGALDFCGDLRIEYGGSCLVGVCVPDGVGMGVNRAACDEE